MFVHMDLEITEVCKMMAASSAEYHYGAFGETASVITY